MPEEAGFFQQDGLRMRGEADVFLARRREGFVGAVAVAGVGGVDVREQQLDRSAREIVFELMRDERAATGLRVDFETLRALAGTEDIAHADGPELPAHAGEREVFDVESAIEEEGKPRAETIHVEAALAEEFDVGEAVRERVGGLLHGRRAGLGDVIAADRNGIPARHFLHRVFDHVGEESERGFEWKNDFVLRLHFLEDVGLDRAAELAGDFRAEAAARGGDIHREDDRRGTVDGHRGGEIRRAERETIEEALHVLDRVDGHAAFADLAEHSVSIAVESVQRRPVECCAETDRALMLREKMEARVRVLREAEAGEETRRFFGRDISGRA